MLGTGTTLGATGTFGALGCRSRVIDGFYSSKLAKVDSSKHGLGLPVDLDAGQLQGALLGHIIVLAFPLLLLELE